MDLSLHMLDLALNSTRAGARRVTMTIRENTAEGMITLIVEDDGCGMDEQTIAKALQWHYSTKSHNAGGMGLPMLKETADGSGGYLSIRSQPGAGTLVQATLHTRHPAYPGVGDMAQTLQVLMAGHPEVDFTYCRTCDHRGFTLPTPATKRCFAQDPSARGELLGELIRAIDLQTKELCSSA